MRCTSSPADTLVHERATEIIGPRPQASLCALRAHLHPRSLNVREVRVEHNARYRVHENRFPHGRSTTGETLQIDWRLHVNEWQWNKLSESARLFL